MWAPFGAVTLEVGGSGVGQDAKSPEQSVFKTCMCLLWLLIRIRAFAYQQCMGHRARQEDCRGSVQETARASKISKRSGTSTVCLICLYR
mmetsp:Transcript_104020/g.333419  ORF Transcript_104020/g.333419 Transcript_104020/m.333419 type:complete len:90 (-) Transcript_104020:212-481(-)